MSVFEISDVKYQSGYGDFLRVDINGDYGDLGAHMYAVRWDYYGDQDTVGQIGIELLFVYSVVVKLNGKNISFPFQIKSHGHHAMTFSGNIIQKKRYPTHLLILIRRNAGHQTTEIRKGLQDITLS